MQEGSFSPHYVLSLIHRRQLIERRHREHGQRGRVVVAEGCDCYNRVGGNTAVNIFWFQSLTSSARAPGRATTLNSARPEKMRHRTLPFLVFIISIGFLVELFSFYPLLPEIVQGITRNVTACWIGIQLGYDRPISEP